MRYILIGVDFRNITDTKKDIDRGVISKQLDLMCNCIRSSLFISECVRRNTETIIFDPDFNKIIVLKGFKLKYMGPDLRSISLLMIRAFNALIIDSEKKVYSTTPGIYIIQETITEYLKNILNEHTLIYYADYTPINETIIKIDSNILIVYFESAVKDKIVGKLEKFNLKPLQFDSKVRLTPCEFIIIYQNYLDLMLNEP
ncbi:MAG: hypothetical protein OdinLCB4_004020 [Candidatus Odinarchaeum yellowstonii]|uniref:Uncharacterized protein n=1 Tax=Odinarchaeota yellowstonii (strain LCB_4) TaxID=1841599 RepID=A0AAF0D0Z6_ODILC|nr:MAG: hypothetical protein OdinLCB4_004020 [Candidatus Odinarchaeum yellowstonii]